MNITPQIKKLAPFAILLAAALIGYGAWKKLHTSNEIAGFASGNGRIGATEIDIATKLPGRKHSATKHWRACNRHSKP